MRPIAISCGEPAGIGPEIAVAAWNAIGADVPMVWIGDPTHLPTGTPWQAITNVADAAAATRFPVLQRDFGPTAVAGQPNPAHAQGVIDAIADAVALVQSGEASAVCTAPIHKQALIDGAGFAYPGHTEYLAALAGRDNVVMMLASDMLRVVPTTIHIPVADVPEQLTAALLTDTILITHAALIRDFAIAKPRLAVAGLNPHAGEGGKMGMEEIEMITPTLNALRAEGLDIAGPLSADTMFHAGARATYDAAICMYHDQALIPIKTLDFSGGVNVTLGLPFVRTSPDHGTAFDIAGTGQADATSMIAALRMAAQMGEART
ncbi:4-hydroxythreonine-4-phosphate dehydrogenase PdxA [Octadecabacter sp. 1_MG-2023]|uniref:4-hydroxythreonine-4-phosphate dehydrogenase PdxA n=1 Tax=unclassified Octadecabacter TaxID=196158 RepID=UPI001C0A16E7|nr:MULTISPECIES: 4-hydroxythreonine-4-phosphate dehydrogenase PdxA [unclassified Octadecabacter]MBU2993597.1 4-hydroxythreonine-4-phosphate dehydrogenase PdxA [Octadecabacter sp. B2R22]MDO6735559.1 4-hydroxythreonine-4-phosphate dehydrogenase PdxA [Octadecabacter sp. 1_MG-2023]